MPIPSPIKILAVDDQPRNLLALEVALAGVDYSLVTAGSGADALECLLEHDFAVIVLDIHMPGMDGFETASLIRARERSRLTPIIFLTADPGGARVLEGYRLGAVDYMHKPFQPDVLRSKVTFFVDLFRKSIALEQRTAELTQVSADLVRREHQLAVLNAELEQRVADRTADLEGTLSQLRAHVGQRTEAEAALRQQAALIDLAPVAIIARDLDGHVTLWNPGAEAMYGWSAEVAIGRVSHELLRTSSPQSRGATEQAVLEWGSWVGELNHQRRDGREVIVASQWALLRDASGRPTAVLEVNTDMTERAGIEAEREQARFAAEQLAEVRAIHQAAVMNLTDGLLILDQEDRVTFWNPRLTELLGLPAGAAVGRALTELDALLPSGVLRPDATIAASANVPETASEAKPTKFSWEVDTDNGLNLLVMTFPITGPDTQFLGHARLVRDVTHERVADRVKDQFVSMVSHELRTPMNGVIGMIQLLLETPLNAYQRECAETIRDSGRALVEIVNDILDISRLEAGEVELEETELDIRSVVEHTVHLLIGPSRRKGVELVGLVDRSVPHRLIGDSGRLRQVLTNLVGNAIKFTDHGEVSLQIGLSGADASDSGEIVLRCEVRDSGIGIQPDAIEHLFEPFKQADSSVTRRYGGTGLGLAICKRLVQAMGGEIGVSSILGQRSTFWFTVRLRRTEVQVEFAVARKVRDLRVLIIDPNTTRHAALREQLAAWGVHVEIQGHALDAVTELECSARSTTYDIVLVTPGSRDGDVTNLGDRLRAVSGCHPPRIIWLSPESRPAEHPISGIWAMLPSPPRQSLLYDVLAEIADQKKKGEEVAAASTKAHSSTTVAAVPIREDAPLVLVVDDVEMNRRVAERMLARLGYRSVMAESGIGALELVKTTPCAAILMDCRMPDMDGFAATAEIRRYEANDRHTPIVALTAHANSSDRDQCLNAGMDDYLSKPVELAELKRMLALWAPIDVPDPVALAWVAVSEVAPAERVLDPGALSQIRALDEPGQPSLLEEIARAFGASLPDCIARLKKAVTAGDAEAVVDAAHALKGAAGAIGAERVQAVAAELELGGREGCLTAGDAQVDRLERACAQAVAALTQELQRAA